MKRNLLNILGIILIGIGTFVFLSPVFSSYKQQKNADQEIEAFEKAKQKITEGVLPSAVYQDVGFRDYSTFYRAFLKMEKISPKEFARFCSDKKDN